MLFAGITISATAQRHGGGFGGSFHGGGYYAPRVSVGFGLGYGLGYPFYSPFYSSYYPYYYSGYGYSAYRHSPKLDMEIQGIQNDYKERIYLVHQDKSVPRKIRKQNIHQLKYEENKEIIEAQKNYYNNKNTNGNYNGLNNNSNNNNPDTNNSADGK